MCVIYAIGDILTDLSPPFAVAFQAVPRLRPVCAGVPGEAERAHLVAVVLRGEGQVVIPLKIWVGLLPDKESFSFVPFEDTRISNELYSVLFCHYST